MVFIKYSSFILFHNNINLKKKNFYKKRDKKCFNYNYLLIL